MDEASKQAEKVAKLVKTTVDKFGFIASDYAKDASKIIKDSGALQHIEAITDVTKAKAKEVMVSAHEKAREVIETSAERAGSVLKEKSEVITAKAKEKMEAVTSVSKPQAEKASKVIQEKMVETKEIAQTAAVALEEKSKEVAKNMEVTIKRKMSEATQSLKEKTEQQLTGLLANLRGDDDDKKYAAACKTVCGYRRGSAEDCANCEKACLKVEEMREEVIKLAKDIDKIKSDGK